MAMSEGVAIGKTPPYPGWDDHAAGVVAQDRLDGVALFEVGFGIAMVAMSVIYHLDSVWLTLSLTTLVLGLATKLTLHWTVPRFQTAYNDLWTAFKDMRDRQYQCSNRLDRSEEFIANFKPTNLHIIGTLTKAAVAVKAACDAEELFLREGLVRLSPSEITWPEGEDPEVLLDRLTKFFEAELVRRHRGVKEAQGLFYRLRNLAADQGYNVATSWKYYAGIKEEKRHEHQMGEEGIPASP